MAETGSTSPNQTVINIPKETLSITLFESTLEKIKGWIDSTNPDSVRRAGDYYLAAQTLLENAARELKSKAVELADHYRGPASVETQKQLQSLHGTIRELADKMGMMGPPLHQYADTLVWAQQNLVVKRGQDSRSDHDTDWADHIPFYGMYRVEDRARDHFYEVNQRIAEHYSLLPSQVQEALPTPTPLDIPDFKDGGFTPGPPPGLPPGGPAGQDSPYGPGGTDRPFDPGQAEGGPYDLISSGVDTNGTGAGGPGTDRFGPDQGAWGPGQVQPSGPSGSNGQSVPGWNGSDPSPQSLDGAEAPRQDLSVPDDGTRLTGLNDTALTGPANALTNGPSSNGGPGIGTPGGAGTGGAGIWGTGGAGALSGVPSGARGGMNGMPILPLGAPLHGQGGESGQEYENTTDLLEDDEVWGSGGPTIPPLLT
ncbi:hypothetical protein [Streptosporangium sp. NPDC002607]